MTYITDFMYKLKRPSWFRKKDRQKPRGQVFKKKKPNIVYLRKLILSQETQNY